MASAVTHLAVGAAIGTALSGTTAGRRLPRWALPTLGAVMGIVPDADVVMHLWVRYAEPLGHRGVFHSPAFFVPLAAAVALVLGPRAFPAPAPRGALLVPFLCALGALLSHSALDMMTDGGLGVAALWPLSDERLFLPWRPIPVSPLGVARFLGHRGLEVLQVEVLFILPAVLAAAVTRRALVRRSLDAQGAPERARSAGARSRLL